MSQSTERDLSMAQDAIRTHCPVEWPNGRRCLNCNVAFPCPAYERAFDVLAGAGWSAEQIRALDVRTSPWS